MSHFKAKMHQIRFRASVGLCLGGFHSLHVEHKEACLAIIVTRLL